MPRASCRKKVSDFVLWHFEQIGSGSLWYIFSILLGVDAEQIVAADRSFAAPAELRRYALSQQFRNVI